MYLSVRNSVLVCSVLLAVVSVYSFTVLHKVAPAQFFACGSALLFACWVYVELRKASAESERLVEDLYREIGRVQGDLDKEINNCYTNFDDNLEALRRDFENKTEGLHRELDDLQVTAAAKTSKLDYWSPSTLDPNCYCCGTPKSPQVLTKVAKVSPQVLNKLAKASKSKSKSKKKI